MTKYFRWMSLGGSCLALASSLYAQAPSDALRNMADGAGTSGTARVQAMGGKAGAMGADPSAVLTNPAGGALFYNDYLSLSFGGGTRSFYPYLGERQSKPGSETTFGSFDNISYFSDLFSRLNQDGTGWHISYGLQYNKDYDYRRNYQVITQEPQTTIADFMALRGQSSNIPYEDFLYDESSNYDPILEPGLDPIVTMGLNGGIIEGSNFLPSSWVLQGEPEVGDPYFLLPDVSNLSVVESGAKRTTDLNLSAGFNSRFFVGASLRVTNSDYHKNVQYSEEFYYSPKDIHINYSYDNELSVAGETVGLSLGALYSLGDYGRVGVSYLLPQYATYKELYYASAGSFNDSVVDEDLQRMGFNTGESLSNKYHMWLPGQLTLSAMAFLGKWGMLTYDFSYMNLANAKFSHDDSDQNFDEINGLVDQYYGARIGNHVGLELRPLSWMSLRAGGSYTSGGVKLQSDDVVLKDEYVASGTMTDFTLPRGTYTASAGVGFRFGGFAMDLAYIYRNRKTEVYPYQSLPSEELYVEGANMDIDTHRVLATLSYSF